MKTRAELIDDIQQIGVHTCDRSCRAISYKEASEIIDICEEFSCQQFMLGVIAQAQKAGMDAITIRELETLVHE